MKTNLFLTLCAVTVFWSCTNENLNTETVSQQNEERNYPHQMVEVVTEDLNFIMPDILNSGWTTFNYENRSHHPHFFVLERLPEGYTFEDWEDEVLPPFQAGMYYIEAFDFANAFAAFGELPAWGAALITNGGSGIVSGGLSAQTTVFLEPGEYVVECYIKMQDGTFHSSLGMANSLIVLEEEGYGVEPRANSTITISSTNGIELSSIPRPGKQTFKVYFEDQIVHENFLGHDVNLMKLENNADINALDSWMNWSAPGGMIGPGPEGVTFISGTQQLDAGLSSYFTTVLKPGRYALVAEVPNPLSKNMLVTFEIPN